MKKTGEKGSALIWALVLLIVVSYATMMILDIQNADIKEITIFKENTSAYYMALGGLEYGYGALMSVLESHPSDSAYKGGKTLFEYYTSKNTSAKHDVLTDNFAYMDGTVQIGQADVSIYMLNKHGIEWVVIQSQGRRVTGIGATGPEFADDGVILYMRINKGNAKDIYRDGKTIQ